MTEPTLEKSEPSPSPSVRRSLQFTQVMRRSLLAFAWLVFVVLGEVVLVATPAKAACVCRCVEGIMQPLCDNTIEIRPICPPTVCPITPPGIPPITPPQVPPLGTRQCVQRQVFNPQTGMYEWRTVCY